MKITRSLFFLGLCCGLAAFSPPARADGLFSKYTAKNGGQAGSQTPVFENKAPGVLDYQGRRRTYLLHLPSGYRAGSALPLVIVLHATGQNAEGAALMTDMGALADREKFIVLYPNGSKPWLKSAPRTRRGFLPISSKPPKGGS